MRIVCGKLVVDVDDEDEGRKKMMSFSFLNPWRGDGDAIWVVYIQLTKLWLWLKIREVIW